MPQRAEAQTKQFEKFMQAYSGVEGITVMDISSTMLRLSTLGRANDKLIDQIKRIIVIKNDNTSFYIAGEFEKVLREGEYEVITSIVEGSQQTKVCIKSESRGENELVTFVNDKDTSVIVCIVGKLSIEQLVQVATSIGV